MLTLTAVAALFAGGASAGSMPAAASLAVAPTHAQQPGQPLVAHQSGARTPAGASTARDHPGTGFTVTINSIEPAAISPGEPLTVRGLVANSGTIRWTDAQVYLSISTDPAISRTGLEDIAATEGGFGTTILKIGLFDQIGAVPPGKRTKYRLSVPYRRLPISGAPGVYHVGVSVLAGNRAGRDLDADARADTTLPLLQEDSEVVPANVIILVPMTAAVTRHFDGDFADDSLPATLIAGGRLRNVLDFAASAPANTLELMVDPALLAACEDLADGYVVRRDREDPDSETEGPIRHQRAAANWLETFDTVLERQHVSLLAWGTPDTAAVADAHLPSVLEASVRGTRLYANDRGLNGAVTDWPASGFSTRRGFALMRSSGATTHLVAQQSLLELVGDPPAYPPAKVAIPTRDGPLPALVTRSEIAAMPMTASTRPVDLRQAMLAEATVRALTEPIDPTVVIAAPLRWNPGAHGGATDLAGAFSYRSVVPISLAQSAELPTTPYAGPVQLPRQATPSLPGDLINAVVRLRDSGQVLVDLLTDQRQLGVDFDRELATAASTWSQQRPKRAELLVRRSAQAKSERIGQVTLAGPSFVTLSSESGRFPLTITNDLDTSVTVQIELVPQDKTLKLEPIEPIVISPGRQRDVEVVSRSDGSGLTTVRARLSTTTKRPFGQPIAFEIRATQIGLFIWIVFGLAGLVIVVASVRRLVTRYRTVGFKTRGEQMS
ncbi:MAG: DUF6049 family protein [Nocardioidaceae bacterium]